MEKFAFAFVLPSPAAAAAEEGVTVDFVPLDLSCEGFVLLVVFFLFDDDDDEFCGFFLISSSFFSLKVLYKYIKNQRNVSTRKKKNI